MTDFSHATYGITLTIYQAGGPDAVLLLDNVNALERAIRDDHIMAPDAFEIYGADEAFTPIWAKHVRQRIAGRSDSTPHGTHTIIEWRDPFHARDEWMSMSLDEVARIVAYWH